MKPQLQPTDTASPRPGIPWIAALVGFAVFCLIMACLSSSCQTAAPPPTEAELIIQQLMKECGE